MRLPAASWFSAHLSPAGVHVVEYRRSGRGLRVGQYLRDLTQPADAAAAVASLGGLLEACGGRGGRVALSVSGFGCRQQILALPRAPDEILRPVVAREIRRFHPDLYADDEEPLIDFIDVDAGGAPEQGRELLVAAAPRPLVQMVVDGLEQHGARVEHWTILPQAVLRLHESFAGGEAGAAVLLMVPHAPVLAFFRGGNLRLFSEPLEGARAGEQDEVEQVLEQLERGALFLRQEDTGAALERLLVAEDAPGQAAPIRRLAVDRLGLRVDAMAPGVGSAGALAALGAALDARADRGLNLLPPEMRPTPPAERWTRRLALASVAVLLAAAGWWAWSAAAAERQASASLARVEEQLRGSLQALARIRPVVDERQSHTQRVWLLEQLARGRNQLPEVLWPVQAAGPTIEVNTLQVVPEGEGWSVVLDGTAHARSNALATDAIEGLYRQLATEIPEGAVSLARLSYASADAVPAIAPIAVSFQMSFIVPPSDESAR